MPPSTQPRYGIDGVPYVVGLSLAAVGSFAGGTLALVRGRRRTAAAAGVVTVAAAVPLTLGVRYIARGKLALRDRMLDAVQWRGDETVVDLGAGGGLLGLGAATRTTGTVHCVDLFIAKDLSGNTPDRLRRNAAALGVDDRVQVHEVDVRRTGLPDGCADVVLSTMCLHNLGDPFGRAAALDEIGRILRPGGTVVISDLAHVEDEYAPRLRRLGLAGPAVERLPGTFPRQRLLVARRAG